MATLSDLRTYVSRDLRDTSNATFSTTEVDDLINQGIDEVSDIYPREIVTTLATVAAGVYTYAATSLTNLYRLDIYTSAGSYRYTLDPGDGDGPTSGWELHGGVLYLPPDLYLTAGDTLKAFGYGAYVQLSASTQTTDLDTRATWGVRVFAQVEAFQRLVIDRAKFQQWQSASNNTDVTALGIANLAAQAQVRWQRQRQRLRRVRKLG